MKLFLFLTILTGQLSAATLCEVYGISDSPQSLSCSFGGDETPLTCQNGTYLLSGVVVEAAYHLEVEEGPTPLVFKTNHDELTVTLGNGRNHGAVFVHDGKKIKGRCHL
jgi:hypothetical protein